MKSFPVMLLGLTLIAGVAVWFLSTSTRLPQDASNVAAPLLTADHNHEGHHQPVSLDDSTAAGVSLTGHAHGSSGASLILLAGATVSVVCLAYAVRRRVAARAMIHMVRSLPFAMQAGLLIMAGGLLVDVLYHIAPPHWTAPFDPLLGPQGHLSHLIITVGMVFTLLGVVTRPVVPPTPAASPEQSFRKEALH